MHEQVTEPAPAPKVFRVEDYDIDPSEAHAYAVATGTAVVVNQDGKPVVVISIPTKDLPVWEDDE